MVSYDDLFQVCVKYTGDRYYVAEAIPSSKLINARLSFPVPQNEQIVALLDTTVFGSGKTGLAISETGLRWRNGLNTWAKGPKQVFLPWDKFASAPAFRYRGTFNVSMQIGMGTELALSGTDMGKKELADLLSEIQSFLNTSSRTSTRGKWMLAMDGKQFGPYDFSTLRHMFSEGQIDLDECLVWKEGMHNWSPMRQVPELATLLRNEASQPQTIPPPPLPGSAPRAPSNQPEYVQTLEKTMSRRNQQVRKSIPERVDLNHASLDNLLSLPGMTLPNGQQVIRERDRRRGFHNVEEVGHLLELQPHQVQQLKERTSVQPYRGGHSSGRIIDF